MNNVDETGVAMHDLSVAVRTCNDCSFPVIPVSSDADRLC